MPSRNDRALRFIGVLEDEHHRILQALQQSATWTTPTAHWSALRDLCRSVRLHLSAECGVFFPKLASATGNETILVRAGVEYKFAVGLLNEIECGSKLDADLTKNLRRLRTLFARHVRFGEGKRGLHDQAYSLPLINWEDLRSEYLKRRADLSMPVATPA